MRAPSMFRRGEEGSLPFALFITMIVIAITGFLVSLAAWQVSEQQATQADQEARWAAVSALNLGIQKFQSVTSVTGIAGRADIPQTSNPNQIPATAAWVKTPAAGTQLHWWAQTVPGDQSRVLLHGEGRSGAINVSGETARTSVAVTSLIVTLNYDFTRRLWIPDNNVRPWEPAIGQDFTTGAGA